MGSCGLLSGGFLSVWPFVLWPFVLWPYVRGLLSVWPFVLEPVDQSKTVEDSKLLSPQSSPIPLVFAI